VRCPELRTLFGTPELRKIPWDRWDALALALSLAVTVWLFVFKLTEFRGGAYADDLFNFTQQSTSWRDGRGLLEETRFGNMLRCHLFFVLIALGPLTKAMGGPPGLLFALALATGMTLLVATRLLRALGVPAWAAVAFATLVALSPTRIYVAQDPYFGFHPENLIPPLVLALLHALLARRTARALVLALLVLSVKEEMPVLLGAVATLVLAEGLTGPRREQARWLNGAALAVLALAIVALPIQLKIIEHNAEPPGSGFWRLSVHPEAARGAGSLVRWGLETFPAWLTSRVTHEWLRLVTCAALGLVVVRPHALLIGFPLTGVSWAVAESWMLQAPGRAATTLAFASCVSLLGFASVWRWVASHWTPKPSRFRVALRVVLAALAVPPGLVLSALPMKLVTPPLGTGATYNLRPRTFYTPAETRLAERVFERYLTTASPFEPVIAAPTLEFLAHYETLLFTDDHIPYPPPEWILWDSYWHDITRFGVSHSDYDVLSARGRFALFKRKPTAPRGGLYPARQASR
jgi:hypothetical protein